MVIAAKNGHKELFQLFKDWKGGQLLTTEVKIAQLFYMMETEDEEDDTSFMDLLNSLLPTEEEKVSLDFSERMKMTGVQIRHWWGDFAPARLRKGQRSSCQTTAECWVRLGRINPRFKQDISRVDPNGGSKGGLSPVLRAAKRGNLGVLKLLKENENTNWAEDKQGTLLHCLFAGRTFYLYCG